MNLLIIPSWYDTPDNPVRGIFFKEQAQALNTYFKKNNINATVTILALQQYNIKERHLYSGIKPVTISNEEGITTIRARLFHIPKFDKINILRGASYLRKLIIYVQKFNGYNFSLIHIHSVQYSGIWYALSGLQIPYIITEHSSAFFRNRISKTERKYLPMVFNKAKSVIAVGKGLAEKIQPFSQKPVNVIFNIIKDIPLKNLENYERDNKFIFFTLGYDIHVKGFDILINAFSKYLRNNSGFLMLGGLKEDSINFLKIQVELLGIQNNVIFLGRIPHDEVYKYMKQSSCFVLPSRFETFGIVLAESMYVGRPVIATRTGGPDSFVTDKCGIIIEPENEDQLVNALIEMHKNYKNYDSNQIRKYALNTFTADVICDKLYKIYTS